MCIAILIVPFFVFALTPNNEPAGWSWIFFLLAFLLIVCNGVFCFFGSAEAAPFTKVSLANNVTLEQTRPIIKSDLEKPSAPPAEA